MSTWRRNRLVFSSSPTCTSSSMIVLFYEWYSGDWGYFLCSRCNCKSSCKPRSEEEQRIMRDSAAAETQVLAESKTPERNTVWWT